MIEFGMRTICLLTMLALAFGCSKDTTGEGKALYEESETRRQAHRAMNAAAYEFEVAVTAFEDAKSEEDKAKAAVQVDATRVELALKRADWEGLLEEASESLKP